MDVGMSFSPGSNLELNVPESIEELGIFTRIALFFNISKDAKGDGRAFIIYVGNTEGTHARMPHTTTDDFIAVEVLESKCMVLLVMSVLIFIREFAESVFGDLRS